MVTRRFLMSVLGAFVFVPLATETMNAADRKGEPHEGAPRTFKSKVINAPEMAGMSKSVVLEAFKAYEVDLKAGRIGKGDEERALRERLDRAFRLNRSSEGLTAKKTAAGVSVVQLEGRFQYVILSRTNADGTVTTECMTDAPSAAAFLTGGPTRAAADRE